MLKIPSKNLICLGLILVYRAKMIVGQFIILPGVNECKSFPAISNTAFSPLEAINVTNNVQLVCSPASKLSTIELVNFVIAAESLCNSVLTASVSPAPNVYNGVLRIGSKPIDIDASSHSLVQMTNFGNVIFWENGVLSGDCAADILTGFNSFVADDPLHGCCLSGVNHLTAVYYKVEIIGPKCGSVCTLLSGNVSYSSAVTN